MRTYSLVFFFVSLFGLMLGPVASFAGVETWTGQGPFGGDVRALAVHPQDPRIVYAGTRSRGLFKTTDGGDRWAQLAGELLPGSSFVLGLILDPSNPQVLYARVPGEPVAKSTDGGLTWRPSSDGIPGLGGATALVLEPSNPSTLYVTKNSIPGIYRSIDGGATWAARGNGLNEIVRALVVDPSTTGVVYAAASRSLFKTTDGGATWIRLIGYFEQRINTLAVDPSNSSTLYIGTNGSGVFKSIDGGITWAALGEPDLGEPAPVERVHYLTVAQDGATLFAGGFNGGERSSGIHRSIDGGATWASISLGRSSTFVEDIAISPADARYVYVAGTHAGIHRSTDGGTTWTYAVRGLDAAFGTALARSPDGAMIYAALDGDGIYASDDRGVTWRPLGGSALRDSETSIGVIVIDPMRPEVLYAASDTGLYRSGDGGATWIQLHVNAVSPWPAFVLDPSDPGVLYLGASYGVYKSTDGGLSFDFTFLGASVSSLAIDPKASNTLYAGLYLGGDGETVWKSVDAGASWSPAGDGLPNETAIWALAFDPNDGATVYAALSAVDPSDGGIYKSVDSGQSWSKADSGFLPDDLGGVNAFSLVVDPSDPLVIYAGTRNGVFISDDEAESWNRLGNELVGVSAFNLLLAPESPRTLYAGTLDHGVVERTEIGPCVPGPIQLCIDDQPGDRRFAVLLRYDTESGGGRLGDALPAPLDPLGITAGGVLSFFNPKNPEVLIKVLDGCDVNGHFWVFAAATTTVGYRLWVIDTFAETVRSYTNLDGNPARTITDHRAFATCDLVSLSAATAVPVAARPAPRPRAAPPAKPDGAAAKGPLGTCVPDATTLCIDAEPGDRRFAVRAHFDTALGGGHAGDAGAQPLASLGIDRGGILWFFNQRNPEVLVKVLDGCEVSGHYWVFFAATTTAGFELTVEDTVAGTAVGYTNPDQTPAETITDIRALATCGAG